MSAIPLLNSAVHRGTAFEKRSLSVLEKYLSMSLRRVGGKSEGGVDLHGWWWLPAVTLSHPSPSYSPVSASPEALASSSSDMIPRRRIRVLAQCKATKQKMGPNIVREMEGVLFQHSANPLLYSPSSEGAHAGDSSSQTVADSVVDGAVVTRIPTVALLISQSPFTRATILRAVSSSVPFFLLHLPQPSSEPRSLEPEVDDEETASIGAAIWNKALHGVDGVLGGQIEARWERNPDGNGGRPGLWWNGRPMKSWVPPSTLL
jgi:hypothetical protein